MRRPAALLLLAAIAAPAWADGLGRLFFTPEQRAQFDREHAQRTTANKRMTALRLDGIVQRSRGARTVWINGIAQNADDARQAPHAHAVAIPSMQQPVTVKVGQRLLLEQPGEQAAAP